MIKMRNLDVSLQNEIYAGGALGFEQLLTQRNNYSKSKIYYVDVNNGSDTDVGDTPGTALATIAAATTLANARIDWSESPWARQDTIVVFPGTYAENLTELPYGCNVIGIGHDIRDAQNGVKIKPASGAPVVVTSTINTLFRNISFESPDTTAAFTSTNLNNCLFENCMFTGPAETATMVGALVCSDLTKTTFRNTWFCNADKGFDINYADGGDKLAYLLMENCYFTGIDTAGMEISADLVGVHNMVNFCHFLGASQTMATGILDNIATINANGCYFDCTDAVNGVLSANGCYMANALVT